ncbi:hypothetical protein AAZX31_14G065600 [Glycine max]|uniref:Actin-related protein 5 n=2 Tax=Glycine subgen. Soja TaxID=1462606 RepID=K7M5B7_SOYBN|nr:actin-related protein 5 [Glycine max]XP_028200123.1 actin-related protein 5-like [Glycine soja]KAG4964783.1 hypothetical protein JHK85_039758 [Glycine max]KAG5121065.1 hypothetical protein JHK84_039405 [Glycine max]KAH1093378.1 hypothetical protein GYH30_039233 [Glycine max]KAH1211966.1 Actin-related protein 5 [Glycine max]KRH15087.1 hypothetical protein GLYMA_14G067800v4 [Glycine max]|eukprot:XP_003545256.1 actin-related protein 5 [Glycine max]
MPFISKIQRQSDFNLFDSNTPLVIDNGASYFRIGWAGESEPRVVFRHIVQRPCHKETGETVTIVGDHDPAFLKYFDCTHSGPHSAFDSNVVYQFETMQYILDFGFDRMGANGTEIDHPVLITECVCNPVQSRSKMAELLFETYGVPSIAFGVDVAFSYKYNQQRGVCAKDCLALCPGFNTTHVIPFVDGEPVYEGCCRTNIGGFHVTDHLKQLLSLKYPYHLARFTWEKVEDLKMEHCYIAPDYVSEARLFQKGAKEAEEKTRYWQIPWVPPPIEEPPSEEEIARKAAIKEKQGQSLREMAEAKRSSEINELENELHGLEFLWHQLEQVEESKVPSFLAETGYGSRQEIESARNIVMQSLQKAKGEPKNEQDATEKVDPATNDSLINIPDEVPHARPLTKEDFQIVLGVERFRCPELLFNPNWIAVDQVGLDEMVGVSIRRLPYKDESLEERLTSSILVTGGSSLFPGIIERLEVGIRMIRPCGTPIKIVRALDPVMDAWRGAASFASDPQFHQQTFSILDYHEKGEDWLRNYQLQYTL